MLNDFIEKFKLTFSSVLPGASFEPLFEEGFVHRQTSKPRPTTVLLYSPA